jgi:hypothetical protein
MPPDVFIGGELLVGRGVVQKDALFGPRHVVSTYSDSSASLAFACREPTATVSLPVVASVTIRCSPPCARINRPRSAPACLIAARISASITFSRAVSPDIAYSFMTVVTSRCSGDVRIVLVGSDSGRSCPSCG